MISVIGICTYLIACLGFGALAVYQGLKIRVSYVNYRHLKRYRRSNPGDNRVSVSMSVKYAADDFYTRVILFVLFSVFSVAAFFGVFYIFQNPLEYAG